MIVLLNTWIYYSIFLKIDLIWWDKFSCNFKYIFINEIGFIKKIVLGRINKILQGRGENPILRTRPAPPRPAPLPSLYTHTQGWALVWWQVPSTKTDRL